MIRLTSIPDPEPAAGEVLVEVARAGINFGDTHVTRNDYRANRSCRYPRREVAGRTPDGRRVAALMASGGLLVRDLVGRPAPGPPR